MVTRTFARTAIAISCVLVAFVSTSVLAQPWPDDSPPTLKQLKKSKAKVLKMGAMHLPPIGDTSQCATSFVESGGIWPHQSCMESKDEYVRIGLRGHHLRARCPAGQTLLGISDISCVNRFSNGTMEGAAYTATACCGVQVAATLAAPMRQVSMGYHGEMNGAPCPQLGVAMPREASSRVPFLAMRMTAMDKGCARDGSRMLWVTFESCTSEFDGRRELSRVQSRVTCGQ